MKRSFVVIALVVAVGLFLFISLMGLARMGPGMMGRGYRYGMGPGMMGWGGYGVQQYCPSCGSYLGPSGFYDMGAGMMGPRYGIRPGMMGGGYQGYGPQYGPPVGPQSQQPSKPLTEKDVRMMVENYIQSTRNPNLKVGKITAKDAYFEAEIMTKNDSLVDIILVDNDTGWMRSMY